MLILAYYYYIIYTAANKVQNLYIISHKQCHAIIITIIVVFTQSDVYSQQHGPEYYKYHRKGSQQLILRSNTVTSIMIMDLDFNILDSTIMLLVVPDCSDL